MSKWIQSAVKHPGSLKRAAERNKRTVPQEESVEAKSSDPHIAARGRLGQRFTRGKI